MNDVATLHHNMMNQLTISQVDRDVDCHRRGLYEGIELMIVLVTWKPQVQELHGGDLKYLELEARQVAVVLCGQGQGHRGSEVGSGTVSCGVIRLVY